MALVTDARLQELFSLALEYRTKGLTDLISNSNVLFKEMKKRGNFATFSGPTIRERLLYAESGTYTRYAGFDTLTMLPAELVNDATFTPKQGAVAVVLPMDEVLKNSGENQLMDVMSVHMDAAEQELIDRFTEDLHSAGAEYQQIGGLQMAVPTTPTNDYGGISRSSNAIWATTTYDANSITVGGTAITAVTSTTIKPLLNYIMIRRSRGNKGPNLILMAEEHFLAYSAATEAIQRVTDNHTDSNLGYTALKYHGAGKTVDIVLEGGIGTAMPANTTYLLDTSSIRFRYHPDRNFASFGGKRSPINQDAVVQYLGFFGELTMNNSLHNAKLYDSAP
jgi:hypothetical protein